MKLTLEEEITIVQETRGLPTGQRCMRLGYPEITLADLENRFAVHKLADAQNARETERVYRELAARTGIHMEEAQKRFLLAPDGTVRDNARQSMLMEMMQRDYRFDRVDSIAMLMRGDEESLWNELPVRKTATEALRIQRDAGSIVQRMRMEREARQRATLEGEFLRREGPAAVGGIKFKRVTGFVKIMGLDEYMEEVIPPRVLDSIQVAREAGLQTFKVAFPCLKVDEIETKQFDPVVFAELGKRWLEIDMWE